MKRIRLTCAGVFATLIFLLGFADAHAQKGKIAGRIIDEQGVGLPGVNVVIDGTTQGSSTDIDGYYTILNVSPGTYTVKATMIGYAPLIVNNVRVSVDLTTEINGTLREEVFQGEEIVVQAERPVVQLDISSNQVNLSKEEIENLPVLDVASVVGLQAGAQGLAFRGGSSGDLGFNVNGLQLRNERSNAPISNISFTSVSNVQVQTGGFNAEYGNIQSGLVNVTTKEGNPDKYEADIITRYTPAQDKNFGGNINDPNSFYLRPFLDPAVAWTGTQNGEWDLWTQRQYAGFEGWISIAESRLNDGDPSNDMTPEALQQAFKWQHRKNFVITDPDYDLDMNISGPVPGISKMLGDLRFSLSLRETQTMYMIPMSRDRFTTNNYMLKLTSDIAKGMKLSVEGMMGGSEGTTSSNTGGTGFFTSAATQAAQIDRVSFSDSRMFSTDYWAPSEATFQSLLATFTHTLNDKTFYQVQLSNLTTRESTNPGTPRNTDPVFFAGGVGFDEGPFGYFPGQATGVGSGLRMGVGMSNSRDSSFVSVYRLKADLTTQYNRFNQFKTGVELTITDSRGNFGSVDEFLPSGRTISKWDATPVRFSAYVQDKLEFEGMIANVGLRMDVSDPNVSWYEFDPFDEGLSRGQAAFMDTALTRRDADVQVMFSPRLGVSFPVTVKSKLFFNYGHFYSMPTPDNLYNVRVETATNTVFSIANPNTELPKTVAYEVGFEQDLFDAYLIRVSGYYRDVSNRPASVRFTSEDNLTNYTINQPYFYQDVRGAEFTLRKIRGEFFRGEVNYTYSIYSDGIFFFRQQFESRTEQERYERETNANEQFRPVPRPFGRFILDFFTPLDFGPEVGGFKPLADWTASFITSWTAGYYFTWDGGGAVPGLINNVQWRDNWNTNLRMSKSVRVKGLSRFQLFLDVNNIFNIRYLTEYGYFDGLDRLDYMRSLHLPGSVLERLEGSYLSVPGDDRPGDYRKEGVDFYPIVSVRTIDNVQSSLISTRPLYYDYSTGEWFKWDGSQFVGADMSVVDQVLEDKAYIDMPNFSSLNFLNPRTWRLGFRVTF